MWNKHSIQPSSIGPPLTRTLHTEAAAAFEAAMEEDSSSDDADDTLLNESAARPGSGEGVVDGGEGGADAGAGDDEVCYVAVIGCITFHLPLLGCFY